MNQDLSIERLAEFIALPAGELRIGSTKAEVDLAVDYWAPRSTYDSDTLWLWFSKEIPAYPVSVGRIHVMRFPLTNALAAPLLGVNSARIDEHPFITPTVLEADQVVKEITRRSGIPFRLPSEAEWEWAARADTRNEFPWGRDFNPGLCNTVESGHGDTTSVAAHPAGKSVFGIEDMAGNVEEWTADSYAPYPGGNYVADDIAKQYAVGCSYRVSKGGSYRSHGDLARVARRHGQFVGRRAFGIRLILDDRYVGRAEDATAALLSGVYDHGSI